MNEEAAKPDQAASEKTPEQGVKVKKPRSPVERVIVWGLILILVAVIFIEWRAKTNYDASFEAVQQEMKASDEGPALTLQAAENLREGNPSRSPGEENLNLVTTYRWFSFFKDYEFSLVYTSDPEEANRVILEFRTPEAVEEQPLAPLVAAAAGDGDDSDDELMEDGGPGGPGGPGGGPRLSPEEQFAELDEDEDGFMQIADAPERRQERLATYDEDEDGKLSEEEYIAAVEAIRAEFRERFSNRGGERPGGEGERPGRPTAESDDTAEGDKKPEDKDTSEPKSDADKEKASEKPDAEKDADADKKPASDDASPKKSEKTEADQPKSDAPAKKEGEKSE